MSIVLLPSSGLTCCERNAVICPLEGMRQQGNGLAVHQLGQLSSF